jgi:hypothetical protein
MTAQDSRPYKAGDKVIFKISGFRREVDENCVLLGYNAASSGNFLPTFRDNLSVPYSRIKNLKMEPIGCPETSVRNHHHSLRNNPEDALLIYAYVY